MLHTVLRSWAADPRPLAGLALGLAAALGPRVTVAEDGDVIARLSVMLDDWTYEAHPGPLGPEGLAIHTVRSVVLKREPLAFAEWLAVVAAHVAEFAGAHPEVRQFFLQHVQQGGRR